MQKRGVGFPIARVCAILSLATGCLLELAEGSYSGKETGETCAVAEPIEIVFGGRPCCCRSLLLFVHDDCPADAAEG